MYNLRRENLEDERVKRERITLEWILEKTLIAGFQSCPLVNFVLSGVEALLTDSSFSVRLP
jgi:hypothetical protein